MLKITKWGEIKLRNLKFIMGLVLASNAIVMDNEKTVNVIHWRTTTTNSG